MMKIKFMGNAKIFFTISAVLIAVIIICTIIMGPRLDIQFKGGSMITYGYDGSVNVDEFGAKADSLLSQHITVRASTDMASQTNTLVVTLPGSQSLSSEQMADFTKSLQEAYTANNLRTLQINNVDPTIGRDFFSKSMWAVVFASILMIIYVAIRFRRIGGMSAGVMAVLALVHDVIIAFGVFVIFRIPVDDNFIAVILTILGYSLNDTIVIYDRIRENKRLMGAKTPISDLVDLSINQSFTRTLNTTITTVMAMIIVAVIAVIYNVSSIQSFAFPMILGLISGSYSSVCIAGPLWVKWQERKLKAKAA